MVCQFGGKTWLIPTGHRAASVRTRDDKKQSRQTCSVGQGSDRGIVAMETGNATPLVPGYVITGENGFGRFLASDGKKLASTLGSEECCFTTYGGLLFGT